jgi:hypothetical protein
MTTVLIDGLFRNVLALASTSPSLPHLIALQPTKATSMIAHQPITVMMIIRLFCKQESLQKSFTFSVVAGIFLETTSLVVELKNWTDLLTPKSIFPRAITKATNIRAFKRTVLAVYESICKSGIVLVTTLSCHRDGA